MRRKIEQNTSQKPLFSPCTDGLKGRATRRRFSHSASQSKEEAAARARTVQSAQETRHYAGNGTYTSTVVAAACEANSCSHNPQSYQNSHRECTKMITDETIRAAKEAVEHSELELKSLSEALDRMKVGFPAYTYMNTNLSIFLPSRQSSTPRGGRGTAAETA